MFIYIFINELFWGEVRRVITNFPLSPEQIIMLAKDGWKFTKREW